MRPDDIELLKDDLLQYRAELESATTRAELVDPCWPRLLATLELIPDAARRADVLELGATPFFLSLCLRRLIGGRITLANWFGTEDRHGSQRLTHARTGEQLTLDYDLFNIETELFPYPDHRFDVVIFSELIEHLGLNPVCTLAEIHRVLRPGGYLILTTPNSMSLERLENYLRAGNPMVDRYSPLFGYGARHNREYHAQQLRDLLDGNGFVIEELVVRDLMPHSAHDALRRAWWRLLLAREATEELREPRTIPDRIARLLIAWETLDRNDGLLSRLRRRYMSGYLDIVQQADEAIPRGEHIFLRARRTEPFRWRFPDSLFDNIEFYVFIRHPWMEMGINDTIQCAGGWYPLEQIAGKSVRRVRGTAQGFLKVPDTPTTFGIELRAEGPRPLTAQIIVWDRWLGKVRPDKVYVDTKLPLAAGGWQRLELPLSGNRPAAGEDVEVRIAIDRDARQPLPDADPATDERRVAVHRFWIAGGRPR